MNTEENPAMNASELVMVRYRTLFLSTPTVRSLKEMPVINETYEGISGRTQGERNDSMPARKAKGKEMSCIGIF
jgi:hypothetical protein